MSLPLTMKREGSIKMNVLTAFPDRRGGRESLHESLTKSHADNMLKRLDRLISTHNCLEHHKREEKARQDTSQGTGYLPGKAQPGQDPATWNLEQRTRGHKKYRI